MGDFAINLIYGTDGNKWTHHMDDANAGGAKVLKWDLRCFDERKPYQRYQTWIDVTFKDPAGKETKSVQLGPQDPFNCPYAGNSTRWSFVGTHMPAPLAGTMELKLRKASVAGKRSPDDPVLYSDTKRLGHQVKPTATASGVPDQKKIPAATGTYTCWVVDRFSGPDKGHPSWKDQGLEDLVKPRAIGWLQDEMTKVAKKTGSFADAKVEWVKSFPTTRKPQELLIYLSSTKAPTPKRLIGAVAGAPPSHGGSTTKRGADFVSEVYPDKIGSGASPNKCGDMVAKLILHEWMHVLLDADSPVIEEVHKRSSGIGVPLLDESVDVSSDDVDILAKHLLKDRTFVKA